MSGGGVLFGIVIVVVIGFFVLRATASQVKSFGRLGKSFGGLFRNIQSETRYQRDAHVRHEESNPSERGGTSYGASSTGHKKGFVPSVVGSPPEVAGAIGSFDESMSVGLGPSELDVQYSYCQLQRSTLSSGPSIGSLMAARSSGTTRGGVLAGPKYDLYPLSYYPDLGVSKYLFRVSHMPAVSPYPVGMLLWIAQPQTARRKSRWAVNNVVKYTMTTYPPAVWTVSMFAVLEGEAPGTFMLTPGSPAFAVHATAAPEEVTPFTQRLTSVTPFLYNLLAKPTHTIDGKPVKPGGSVMKEHGLWDTVTDRYFIPGLLRSEVLTGGLFAPSGAQRERDRFKQQVAERSGQYASERYHAFVLSPFQGKTIVSLTYPTACAYGGKQGTLVATEASSQALVSLLTALKDSLESSRVDNSVGSTTTDDRSGNPSAVHPYWQLADTIVDLGELAMGPGEAYSRGLLKAVGFKGASKVPRDTMYLMRIPPLEVVLEAAFGSHPAEEAL